MATLEENQARWKELKKERASIRAAIKEEREERFSLGYRMNHSPFNEKPLTGMWAALSVFVVAYLAVLVIATPFFQPVGSERYVMDIEQTYDCPFCDWSGNASMMTTHDGAWGVNYYCPDCGHVIGNVPYGERQAV
jgi:predicted RNA-binding Zn-ribbon protein involved in translation (DUF1610 family)